MNKNSRFTIVGVLAGILLLIMGIVRDNIVPEVIGGLLIVVSGVRLAMMAKKPSQ